MRIELVQLENIRSHEKTEIPFAPGFNCLVGGLGRGKSTVLYAIDFALFGEPLGRSYDYLLREGAKKGRIVLHFVHGGKNYRILRVLRKQEGGISQDMEQLKFFEEDRVIASTKNEAVIEQLKAITGLDKELFREVVWVPQEHLKELLDMTPRQRQKKMDQLFGLSDYEVAWSELAGFQREYESETKIYERDADIVGMEKLQADHNKATEEFSLIQKELENQEQELTQAEAHLEKTTTQLQSIEELRRETEELRRKEATLQSNIASAEATCARLTKEIEEKRVNIKELGERLKKIENQEKSYRNKLQEAGLEPDQGVEEIRKHLAALDDQMASIRGKQEATKIEMDASQNRISNLETENSCPLCLQALTGDYKKALLGRLREENEEQATKLAELQKNLDDLDRLHLVVDMVVPNLQGLIPRIEETKIRISEEEEALDRLSEELGEAQEKGDAFRGQLEDTQAEISRFDVTELETARRLRDSAFEEHSTARSRLESLKGRREDIELMMDGLKERLDNAKKKVERKEAVERLLRVINDIRGAYRSIQPRLRSEFVSYLERMVQQGLDDLVGAEGPTLFVDIDDTYTPAVKSEEGYEREASNLSGGERTLLAFAYRLGLGQLIMQSRTGHGLYLLLLDEPTESLGQEDGSVYRLADAISRSKAIQQIIAVTHSEAFAEKAEHVIRVEKEADASMVSVEK